MKAIINNMKLLNISLFAIVCTACQLDSVRDDRTNVGGVYVQSEASVAGRWHSDIHARIERAKVNIDQGEERGWLIWAEASKLRVELNEIIKQVNLNQTEDNRFDHKERANILKLLDYLENEIYKESRDDQFRRR